MRCASQGGQLRPGFLEASWKTSWKERGMSRVMGRGEGTWRRSGRLGMNKEVDGGFEGVRTRERR